MEPEDINFRYQQNAHRNLQNAPSGSQAEAAWMQNTLLAEIAIQLAILNRQLAEIQGALYSISSSITLSSSIRY